MLDCESTKVGGGVLVWPAGENIGNLIMDGKKPLHLPRRLEPLHDPLSSSRRLVGILGPVVDAFVLPMLDAGHDLTLGRGVAAQLVGDQHTRRSPLLLQQLAQQAFSGSLVAPALDEDIENKALLVDRAPEPVLRAGDGDHDLIEVALVHECNRGKTPGPPPPQAGWPRQRMRSASGRTAGAPGTPSLAPRYSQKATPSLRHVLPRPRNASRQSRPVSLRVPPLMARLVIWQRMSNESKWASNEAFIGIVLPLSILVAQ